MIYQDEAKNFNFLIDLKQKIKENQIFSHFGYYWKMDIYAQWSLSLVIIIIDIIYSNFLLQLVIL